MAAGTKRKSTRLVAIDPSKLTRTATTTSNSNSRSRSKKVKLSSLESLLNPRRSTAPAHSHSQDGQQTASVPHTPTQADGMLWSDRFTPSEPSQLAVHPKKLALVHAWLSDAIHAGPHTRKYRRLLVLAGPAGAGKSAIIHTLAHHPALHTSAPPPASTSSARSAQSALSAPALDGIGYEILEWKNTGNESSVSKPQEFGLWLMRASAGPTLSFNDDADEEEGPTGLSPPCTGSARGPKLPTVLLVDDLPNLSHADTGRMFVDALRQHLHSRRPATPPLVVIISDTSVTPGAHGFEERAAGGFAGPDDRPINVHTLLPTDILHHPAACLLKLLPVNNTLMKKLLARTVQIAAPTTPDPSFLPGPKHLDFVVEASNGDLRAALNNLQLLFALPSRKIGKSGDSRSKRNDALSGPPSLFNRQLLGSRDESLVIFHSLGKILYNKRWGDDAKEDAKDKRVRGPRPDPLPAFWAAYQRRQMKTDIDKLYADLSVSVDQFVVYLHHNYPPFTDTVDEAASFLEYLSLSDATMTMKEQNRYNQAAMISYYHFHLSARAVLLGLPSPVTRRGQKFFKPALWGHLRQLNENAALAHAAPLRTDLLASLRPPPAPLNQPTADDQHRHLPARPARGPTPPDCWSVLSASKTVLAVEVLPFLGLLASSLGAKPGADHPNDELLERFSRWEYPNARPTEEQLSEDDVPDCSPPEPPPPAARPPPPDPDIGLESLQPRPTAGLDEEPLWFEDEDDIVD
ncbi:hypothetical protein PtB15_9B459 [Puccinia triticina]|nr:hypothetical protein PtB15_9B459 [Puccinia triticina]